MLVSATYDNNQNNIPLGEFFLAELVTAKNFGEPLPSMLNFGEPLPTITVKT